MINEEKKTIRFEDEEDEEEFYQEYGLEPDEQHKTIQKMSLLPIEKKMWREWFLSTFSERQIIIDLPNDALFRF